MRLVHSLSVRKLTDPLKRTFFGRSLSTILSIPAGFGQSRPKDTDFGRTALVWDDVGHYEGIAAAEFLIHKKLDVTFVTGNISFAHRMEHSFTTLPALERLTREDRLRILTRHKLVAIRPGKTSVCAVYNAHVFDVAADTVVLISYNRPNRELVDELADFTGEVKVVGDANSPRYLMLAIREGYLAGRSVLAETTQGMPVHDAIAKAAVASK